MKKKAVQLDRHDFWECKITGKNFGRGVQTEYILNSGAMVEFAIDLYAMDLVLYPTFRPRIFILCKLLHHLSSWHSDGYQNWTL